MLSALRAMFRNRVMWYLLTRYFTYFIQFVTSIFIAIKLGAYNWGIWGFILLLLNYFQVINFGISNALNVFMVQFKNDAECQNKYIASSIISIGVICIVAFLLVGSYYWGDLIFLEKYEFSKFGYWIVFIAILAYFNNLFMVVYRVKNSLFEVSFYQSIIPLLLAVVLFVASGRKLLYFFLFSYIIGNGLSVVVFLVRGKIAPLFKGLASNYFTDLWKKGLYLFIYNVSFYLILISTRTIISAFYPVETFGQFTFAFTLAHAILLLLEAFSFIIFPKVLARLNDSNPEVVLSVIERLRVNYIGISHGLIYVAMLCFPLFFIFFPQYKESLYVLNFISLTLLMRVNSFGFSSFLMVKNRDKEIAAISLVALLVNIAVAMFLVNWNGMGYEYIIFATMLSYMLYSYLCVSHSLPLLNKRMSFKQKFLLSFPLKTLIPYIIALMVSFTQINLLSVLPLLIYVILNRGDVKEIFVTIKKILYKPEIVNM